MKNPNSYFKYSSLGLQMIATIGFFILLGRYLDKNLELQKPWFTLTLSLLGCIGTIFLLIKKIK